MAQTAAIRQDEQALVRLATPEVYQRYRIPLLDGGVRTDIAPTDMQPNQSPEIINLTLVGNVLQVDTGYGQFGSVIDGLPFFGTPQVAYQIFNQDGTTVVLLFTTASIYQLNSALMQWQLVPTGSYKVSVGGAVAGANTIQLTSVTLVNIGTFLGLPLDDGEQLPVTVTGIVGSVVAFDPPVPAGRNVPNASNIALAAGLHGTLLNQIEAVSFSPKNWTIFTNNVDDIFYFDGTFLQKLNGLPTDTTCKFMIVFHESLFLFNTTETGQSFPQRVRMSDLGDPQAWTPGAGASIAAIYDLLDTEDFIQAAAIIGPYLIVFRDTTIMQGQYLGIFQNIMFWQYMIYGEGLVAPGGLTDVGALAMFVGNGGIYTYDGVDYTIDSVGDGVFIGSFSAVGDLNSTIHDMIFSQYVPDYDEVWFFYPAGTASTLPNKMIRQSLEKSGWFYRFFANKFVGASPYLPVETTTWASAVGTWAQQQLAWNSRVFLANIASILLCSADTNLVYVYDYKTQGDAGVPVAWSFQTKDIDVGDQMDRWDSLRAYGKGNGVLVEISLDGGQTFSTIGTFNFGTGRSLQILTFQAVSSYIRFRLSGNDPNFALNWMELWYLKESEW